MLEILIQKLAEYLQTPDGQSRFSYYVGKLVQSAEQKLRQKREEEERRKRQDGNSWRQAVTRAARGNVQEGNFVSNRVRGGTRR